MRPFGRFRTVPARMSEDICCPPRYHARRRCQCCRRRASADYLQWNVARQTPCNRRPHRLGKRKIFLILRGLRCLKELADLRGEDVFTPILVVKKVAVSPLCQTQSVPRSHVIVSNPRIPCGFDGGIRIFVGNDREFISERNPSHTEPERRLVVPSVTAADSLLHAAATPNHF